MQQPESISPILYLIPGYTADYRVFDGLKAQGIEFVVLEHPVPTRGESFQSYSKRIAAEIDTSRPFMLGGLSMGGMITMEICKYLTPEKVILISSTKDRIEFPWFIQLTKWLPLWRITPAWLLKWWSIRFRFIIGRMKGDDLKLFKAMMWDSDPYYFRWSMGALAKWDNMDVPPEYCHIHGNGDWLLPYRFIKGKVETVEGGTHWMVVDRAEEVAGYIRQYISGSL